MPSGDDQVTVGFTPPPGLSAVADRYDLLAEIGRGGMGVVYKARDRHTGAIVALKTLHPAIASDPHLLERFTSELLITRRITHKNVCRVHDLNDFGGAFVITMELVEGRSLRALLREVEAVSIRQGLKIARQLAAGLAEAHAQGVVHRDLKPENIVIGRDGAVKIMDFGIARLMDSRLTATGQLLGTPAYMSPEQAEGKPVDARSDIYSLGLVLYEMFCGRPAFAAATPIALVAKHVSEIPAAPRTVEADLPPWIDAVIRRCLEKQPAKRFQSVVELDAALAGRSSLDEAREQPAVSERLSRWRRSDWIVAAAAATGLIVFFPCFERVSLAPRSQVTFDRAVLRRIAEEHLQRFGLMDTPVTQTGATNIDPGAYVYIARTYGAAAARGAANRSAHYWSWLATFAHGSLEVDHRGRLIAFSREAVASEPNARSFDDARQLAVRTVQELFGQPAAALRLEHETRGEVDGFAWLGPPIEQGPRQRYSIDVDRAGVSSARVSPDVPRGYSLEFFPFGEVTMNEWGMPVAVAVGLLVCAFGLVNRHAVLSGPWRTAIVGVAFVVGVVQSLGSFRFFGIGDMVAVPLALGVLFAVVAYFASIAVELLTRNKGGAALDTLTALFRRRTSKQASALATLRGSALGLALLGLDTLAVWLATTYLSGRLSMVHIGLLGGVLNGSPWPVGVVLGIAIVQTVGIGLLVAVADAVVARARIRPLFAGVATAAVLAATGIRMSMGAVQPASLIAPVLFVDFALLIAVYRWFDLLTMCVAIGTFGFWWANYPLLVMQQPIGAVGARAAFAGWGVMVTAAAALAFEPELRRGYQRVAAALR